MNDVSDAGGHNDDDAGIVSEPDVWRELGDLPPSTVISESGLARLTGRHPISIKRAVERGELPPAPRLLGQSRWTVGSIIDFLNERIQNQIKLAAKTARRLEDEHRQVRLGYRPARSAADRHRRRPITEVQQEYLDWGRAQGGRGGLRLDAEWTKNRKDGLQPLPADLLMRLKAFAESGEPDRLYKKHYTRNKIESNVPDNPLLYVPSHAARAMDMDLEAAGIAKVTPAGKLDFHACRLAYINMVIESGATIKEAQEWACHSTPQLTMNVYGRVRQERLAQTVDKVADALRQDAQ